MSSHGSCGGGYCRAVEIEVWSDVVCPWCYIGRRRLQQALAERPDLDVTIRHRAFQLQPDAPHDHTVPTGAYLAEKYGISEERVREMQDTVIDVARSVGLTYNLEHTLTGNTRDAHRLLLWAAEFDRQDELLEQMYAAYFTKGASLFDERSLLDLVDSAGLDPAEASRMLASDRYMDDIRNDVSTAQQLGATGVPFFVFDRAFGIAGAQPLEVFRQTLEAAAPSH